MSAEHVYENEIQGVMPILSKDGDIAWRILHNGIVIPKLLYQWSKRDTDYCPWCPGITGTIDHMFFDFPSVTAFWNHLARLIHELLGPHPFNIGTISGTTHFKALFRFSPGAGENFVDDTLCISNNSFLQFIRVLHPSSVNKAVYKPPKRNKLKGEGTGVGGVQGIRRPVPVQGSGNSLSRKVRNEHDGRSEVVHRLTSEMFLQECARLLVQPMS
jgi:hypothetical protein